MQKITIEAKCSADLVRQVAQLDHETRAIIQATENGREWAVLEVKPMTDTVRAAFPLFANRMRGSDRKRGEAGVMYAGHFGSDSLSTVINRARKMHRGNP